MFDYELVPVESFYTYFFVQAIAVTFGEVKFYVRAVSMNVVTDYFAFSSSGDVMILFNWHNLACISSKCSYNITDPWTLLNLESNRNTKEFVE